MSTQRVSRWFGPAFGGAVTLLLGLSGCATVRDDVRHVELAYADSRYEDAQRWIDQLDHESAKMDHDTSARFHYLRGMTAFRLGDRDEALYQLAVARELGGPQGEGLEPEWKVTLDRTLEELTPTDALTARARPAAANP